MRPAGRDRGHTGKAAADDARRAAGVRRGRLRLLRLARLAAQLGFTPDAACLAGARESAKQIDTITAERIFAELQLILHADQKYGVRYAQYEGLKLLDATGVLERVLPELTAGRGLPQRADFHAYDVLEHSLRACRYADPRVRFSALLHDIGKPAAYRETGKYHGARRDRRADRARGAAAAEGAFAADGDGVPHDRAAHVRPGRQGARGEGARLYRKELRRVRAFAARKTGGLRGCKDDTNLCPTIAKWESIREAMVREGVPFTLKDLAVKGDDLKDLLPARRIGETLQALLLRCAQGALQNRRDALLREAARLAAEKP